MNRAEIIKAGERIADWFGAEEAGETIRSLIALVPGEGMVVVPEEVVNFLHGAGPLDGCHFGEKPPKERGQYWWRKHLPMLKAAEENK